MAREKIAILRKNLKELLMYSKKLEKEGDLENAKFLRKTFEEAKTLLQRV